MPLANVKLALVADGHPEWAVATYVDQECRDSGNPVHCVFWKAAEYESRVVHSAGQR
ncbi:MAG: hypothetical protein IS632_09230 [Thaumarchaeota archaeon]|nr:hypothetical protein [Nitrososphaerota archaeon]